MSRLYLVRHASHDRVHSVLCGRMPGIALSKEGREEARALARRLIGCKAEAILSSPRERAQETASIIAGELGLPVELAPDLDDIDFGEWTGRSFAELADDPLWATWNAARSMVRPPGGESMEEAGARALGLLRDLAGPSVVVSHCDVIRAVLLHILGLTIDSYDRIAVDPASLSTLDLWPCGGRVAGLNERPGGG
jgi:broad specificity phosphatase PhoE